MITTTDINGGEQQNRQLKQAIAERERAERRLHEIRLQLLETTIARERDAMAREIHDSLSQVLAGVIVQLEAAEELLTPGQEALRRHLVRARDEAREGLAHTRRIAWAWRTGGRLSVGELPKSLEQLCHRLFDSTDISFHVSVPQHRHELPAAMAASLLMVAQEALANALLHSRATEVWVDLRDEEEMTHLFVRDNGTGFDLTAARNGSEFGLTSMEERVHQMAGQLRVETAPGRGTTIEARVPNPVAEAGRRQHPC